MFIVIVSTGKRVTSRPSATFPWPSTQERTWSLQQMSWSSETNRTYTCGRLLSYGKRF